MSRREPAHDARRLERERIASMADEGGTAAARVEAQPAASRPAPPRPLPRRRWRRYTAGMLIVAGFAATVVLVALRRAGHGPRHGSTVDDLPDGSTVKEES